MRAKLKSVLDFLRDYAWGVPLDFFIWAKSGHAVIIAVLAGFGALVTGVLSLLDFGSPRHDLLIAFDTCFAIAVLSIVWSLFVREFRRRSVGGMIALIFLTLLGALIGVATWAAIQWRAERSWAATISIGRITPNFAPLEKDGYIQLQITVFSFPTEMKLAEAPSGKIGYEEILYAPDQPSQVMNRAMLDVPQIDPSGGFMSNGPPNGTWITLRQYIPPSLRQEMLAAITDPRRGVSFTLNDLRIMVSAEGSRPVRLPLWDGIICRQGVFVSRVVSVAATIGPSRASLSAAPSAAR